MYADLEIVTRSHKLFKGIESNGFKSLTKVYNKPIGA